MIVNRRTFIVKKGKMDELVTLLVNAKETSGEGYRLRIYHSMFGPFDTIAMEIEVKDMDDLNHYFEGIRTDQNWVKFIAKFDELTVPGGSNEIWTLAQ